MHDDIATISRYANAQLGGMGSAVANAARRLLNGIEDDADREVLRRFAELDNDTYPRTCEAIARVLDARSKP